MRRASAPRMAVVAVLVALILPSCGASGSRPLAIETASTHSRPPPLRAFVEEVERERAMIARYLQARAWVKAASRSQRRPRPAQRPPEHASSVLSLVAHADVERAICDAFGGACADALRVARCESGLRPNAMNGQFRGLFQIGVRIHVRRIARMGYTVEQMWEVGPNIAVAKAIYSEGFDWHQWECQP